jgi:hypothetical protein
VNLFFGTRFTDLTCGYDAYWRELIPALDLPTPDVRGPRRGLAWGEGPEIDTLTTIRMAAQGLRVVEVATVGYPRIHGDRPRRLLPAALRAVRTAGSEYVRRWRIGHRPTPRHHETPHYAAPAPHPVVRDDQPTGRHAARGRRRDGGRRRPDLTVIRGEGRDERWDGQSHLRAVPGENYRDR